MQEPADAANTVRFGVFETDLRARQLHKAGIRVRVQQQPFQILEMLLRRPGVVVTREDLRAQLWPSDTFVDFEHSLNSAIKKLRDALGDDANNPRFIETLPRLGYRFIAPVIPSTDLGGKSEWTRGRKIAATALTVLLLAIVAAYSLTRRKHGAVELTQKDTIVLAEFTNATADPVFDGTLRQAMAVQLEQSPFLNLVSEQEIQQTLALMGQPVDAKLTPVLARELCQRTGSAAVLEGSITSLGSQYVLGFKAVNCRTGGTLTEEQVRAPSKEQVLAATDKVAAALRHNLGESLSTVEKFSTPLEQSTTPSLEALQAYTLATEKNRQGEPGIPFFKRALQLDPNFAMAYTGLGY